MIVVNRVLWHGGITSKQSSHWPNCGKRGWVGMITVSRILWHGRITCKQSSHWPMGAGGGENDHSQSCSLTRRNHFQTIKSLTQLREGGVGGGGRMIIVNRVLWHGGIKSLADKQVTDPIKGWAWRRPGELIMVYRVLWHGGMTSKQSSHSPNWRGGGSWSIVFFHTEKSLANNPVIDPLSPDDYTACHTQSLKVIIV